jgi:predicted DNA-binding transcriptional regulator AlpA
MQIYEPSGLISMRECMRLLSVSSRSTVYGYLKHNPDFPRPCMLSRGRSRIRFKASEITRFIEGLPSRS